MIYVGVNNDLISRLHSIMRPFLLRRLKKDVAKQLPGKFEHIVMCRLSKRQLFLYEEYVLALFFAILCFLCLLCHLWLFFDIYANLYNFFSPIFAIFANVCQFLSYDVRYMSRSTTRQSLTGGGYLGMMNILMQLRKCCNHPDLFEPRPISSPFLGSRLVYTVPTLATRVCNLFHLCTRS